MALTTSRMLAPLAAAMLLASACSTPPARSRARSAEPPPAADVAAAEADFPSVRNMCDLSRATRVPDFAAMPPIPVARPLPPARVFDNLYFVGNEDVSSWAIATDAGIILIDALNSEAEVRLAIEPGLRSLGLDPGDIRYVLVTHGHGDHYGGAAYLAKTYGARIVMSAIDWDALARPPLQFDNPGWGRPPPRDVAVRDGDTLRLGSTIVRLMVAGAHTPGTINPVFAVTENGRTHRAMLWGGMAFNFGRIPERLEAYAAEALRARRLARDFGIDILLASHSSADGSRGRIAAMLAAGEGARSRPNPFVIGRDRVANVLARIAECARANAAAAPQG